jgi:hypothetical protein
MTLQPNGQQRRYEERSERSEGPAVGGSHELRCV